MDFTDVLACSTACYKILQGSSGSTIPPLEEEEESEEEEIQPVRKKNKSNIASSSGSKMEKEKASVKDSEETIKKLSATEIEVATKRRHRTAMYYPCRKNCGALVNVGTYGMNGGGQNG